MREWVIRTFGLKGSWYWAKKQMRNGKVVACRHWPGTLKYSIDREGQSRLQRTFSVNIIDARWETAYHFLDSEDATDWYVVGSLY